MNFSIYDNGDRLFQGGTETYSGFPRDLIATILCPRDGGSLRLQSRSKSERIAHDEAECVTCASSYEIRDGILCLLPGQQSLDATTRDEQQSRDRRANKYEEHFAQWENSTELAAIVADGERFRSKIVLDLACGTGRITRRVSLLASATIAADFSLQSLRVMATKISGKNKIGLVWGDATQLRFVPASFDVVVSTQLLEHIPTADKRTGLIREVHSAIRPAGALLLTVYYYSLLRQVLRTRREGFHSGGIFYHRFTASEIRRELGEGFEIVDACALQPDRRVISRLPWAKSWLRMRMPYNVLASLVGQLLFIAARKTSRAKACLQVSSHVA